MAEMKNLSRKGLNSHEYYVLLKERTAEKREKVYNPTRNDKKYQMLLQGEILFRNLNSKAVDENTGLLTLQPYGIGRHSYFSQCPVENVEQVDEEEAMLLLSINSLDQRFKLYKSESLKNAKRIIVGSCVNVKVQGGKQGLKGVVRFKGPLPDEDGKMFAIIFGVELKEGAGRETTNGFFKGVQYFKCKTDCGVFVSFEKLTMCEDFVKVKNNENHVDTKDQDDVNDDGILNKAVNKLKNVTESISSLVFGAQENSLEQSNKAAQHKGERVWVYIPVDGERDKLCAGYIRYIGRIPGHDGTLAGIELDHPVGQGNGDWYGKQLFNCQVNHAYFTRIENVISQEKLQELYEQPKNDSTVNKASLEAKNSSVPQTSQDIINMESNFSKQSTTRVVQEQQKLFEKIKQEGEQERTEKRNLEENRTGTVSQKTVQVNNPGRVPRSLASISAQPKNIPLQSNLDVGSMVTVLSRLDKPRYGILQWIGFVPDIAYQVAGVELKEEMNGCADGRFLGKRYFTCPNGHGLFVYLNNCLPDPRFNKNSMENAARKHLTGTEAKHSSVPQTSQDIINMESNFSKQSTAQVVKEQQQHLEKINQEGEQKRTDKRNLEESRTGDEAPLDKCCKTKDENPSKVTQPNIQVNNARGVPRSPASTGAQPKKIPLQSNLDVGSMVEILGKLDKPRYGVLRWIGFVPDVSNKIAGVELEEEMNGCADGTFLGKRYFTCRNRHGLFVHLHNCVPDPRFNENSMENAASKHV